MATQYEPDMALITLVLDVLDSFRQTREHRPRPESRELLVRTLDGLMANGPDYVETHIEWLEEEITQRGTDFELKLLGCNSPDLPDEAILAGGFGGASDDVLVDVICSPSALEVMYRYVNDPAHAAVRGVWFDAAKREG